MASRKKAATRAAKPDIQAFLKEFAERQNSLLEAVVSQVKAGKFAVDDSDRADVAIEAIVSDWCDDAEPSRELHMHMLAAVFYQALLDALYGHERAENPDGEGQATTFNDLMIEAMKTARSIWGKP